ncbi:hypothetical protein DB88DRAFT_513589 [Papiliotrema laurentii]|uniref:Malate dehydrogenase n=1 Tax=Papiliotrema laurentii TaxID=5418 RepID=A0AAD9FMG4_PAPLA|nr:hypothetical protein DB88DRAFT_513589 [Papiliotrema laurentii]
MLSLQATCLLLLTSVMGAPTSLSALQSSSFNDLTRSLAPSCPLGNFQIPLPSGLTLSPGQQVKFATVGRGTQNYTCTNGAFVSSGAVADLYDVSCLFKVTAPFIPTATLSKWLPIIALNSLPFPGPAALPLALDHYFIATPDSASGISPVFASSTDRIVAKRDASVPAANASVNVPYVKLIAIDGQGTLAETVFRLDTANGQPPSTCSGSETITVQYAAMYYLTK